MHLIAAVRGATAALMAEVLEDHVRTHFVTTKRAPASAVASAAEELIDVVRTYVR